MKRILFTGTLIGIITLSNLSVVRSQSLQSNPNINPDYQDWAAGKSANYTSDGHALGYIPSPYKLQTEIPSALKEKIMSNKVLPSLYDLRTLNGVTSVKDQANCGSCWTFGAMAAIESRWLLAGRGTYDLSEDNLNTCHPPFLWAPCAGGNSYISLAYLIRGSGPISESDDPYSDTHTSVDCPTGLTPQGLITSGWFIPRTDASLIKSIIMEYGALATAIYYTASSYNSGNYTYYYSGSSSTNHIVTLVGWDDNKVTAGGTGAWIIKNSWGTSWGESGYFYIAYQDSKVNTELTLFNDYTDYDENVTVSTYAEGGFVSSVGAGSNVTHALVKFTPDENTNLFKIGTWAVYPGALIDIEVYDNFDGTTLTNLLGTIPQQTCTLSGYYSADLPAQIALTAGNDYYVKIRYQTTGYNYPAPIEMYYSGFCNPTIETGKCWLSTNAGVSWISLDSYDWDLSIYAYSVVETLEAPEAPVLTSPADGSVEQSCSPSLEWDPSSGATGYHVQLSTDAGFGSTILDQSNYTSTNIIASSLDTNTIFYWRVNASNTGGTSAWSDIFSFTTGINYAWLETECAQVGSLWDRSPDTDASNNAYIEIQPGNNSSDNAPADIIGHAIFPFHVCDGSYIVWTRVKTPTPDDDSYWVKMDDGEWIRWNNITNSSTWIWDNVKDETKAVVSFDLSAGDHELTIAYREDGAKLDKVFITATGETPTGVGEESENCTGNEAPIADFIAPVTTVLTEDAVEFTDLSVGDISDWQWDLGDDSTSIEQSPSHIYLNPGKYTVKLSVAGINGADIDTKTNYITVKALAPVLVSPANGAEDQQLILTLTWNPSLDESEYSLQVSATSGFSPLLVNQSGLTTTTYDVTDLDENTTYFWKVKTLNNGVSSDWSEVWNFSTATFTAINPLEDQELYKLYPIPVLNMLYIVGIENEFSTVSIFSSDGRLILQQSGTGIKEVDMSCLSKGSYIVKISNATAIYIKNIVKE
jgi:C1A family cysteine protease/PKD repeat protein